jgi:replication factor C large subunit
LDADARNTFAKIYAVDSLSDIQGNDAAIAKLRRFAEAFVHGGRTRPIMLSGPPGVGKTSSAYALAKENGWNLIELSASEYRDKESVERIAVAASSRNVFGKRNMILLDEVDDLAKKFDKGAESAIAKLIQGAANPVVLTSNNAWDKSIRFLRGKVDSIDYIRVRPEGIEKVLKKVAAKAGLKVDSESIGIISRRSNGDVRSALNDMYAIAGAEKEDAVDALGLRNAAQEIFIVLNKIFYSNTLAAPLVAARSVEPEVSNDLLISWIDENIPGKYRHAGDMNSAYENLALATMYSSRATRRQYYGYWRYMSVLMTSGISLAKTRYPQEGTRYMFPKVIKELSASKSERTSMKQVATKLTAHIHFNTRYIIENEIPMLSSMANAAMDSGMSKEEVQEFFADRFGLDSKEADLVIKGRA